MKALPKFWLKAIDLLLKKDSLRMWIEIFKISSFPVPCLILHKKRAERCLISGKGKKKKKNSRCFFKKEHVSNVQ